MAPIIAGSTRGLNATVLQALGGRPIAHAAVVTMNAKLTAPPRVPVAGGATDVDAVRRFFESGGKPPDRPAAPRASMPTERAICLARLRLAEAYT
jgi:hypothetical protein